MRMGALSVLEPLTIFWNKKQLYILNRYIPGWVERQITDQVQGEIGGAWARAGVQRQGFSLEISFISERYFLLLQDPLPTATLAVATSPQVLPLLLGITELLLEYCANGADQELLPPSIKWPSQPAPRGRRPLAWTITPKLWVGGWVVQHGKWLSIPRCCWTWDKYLCKPYLHQIFMKGTEGFLHCLFKSGAFHV